MGQNQVSSIERFSLSEHSFCPGFTVCIPTIMYEFNTYVLITINISVYLVSVPVTCVELTFLALLSLLALLSTHVPLVSLES